MNYAQLHNQEIAESEKYRKQLAENKMRELKMLLVELERIDKEIEALLS